MLERAAAIQFLSIKNKSTRNFTPPSELELRVAARLVALLHEVASLADHLAHENGLAPFTDDDREALDVERPVRRRLDRKSEVVLLREVELALNRLEREGVVLLHPLLLHLHPPLVVLHDLLDLRDLSEGDVLELFLHHRLKGHKNLFLVAEGVAAVVRVTGGIDTLHDAEGELLVLLRLDRVPELLTLGILVLDRRTTGKDREATRLLVKGEAIAPRADLKDALVVVTQTAVEEDIVEEHLVHGEGAAVHADLAVLHLRRAVELRLRRLLDGLALARRPAVAVTVRRDPARLLLTKLHEREAELLHRAEGVERRLAHLVEVRYQLVARELGVDGAENVLQNTDEFRVARRLGLLHRGLVAGLVALGGGPRYLLRHLKVDGLAGVRELRDNLLASADLHLESLGGTVCILHPAEPRLATTGIPRSEAHESLDATAAAVLREVGVDPLDRLDLRGPEAVFGESLALQVERRMRCRMFAVTKKCCTDCRENRLHVLQRRVGLEAVAAVARHLLQRV